jgi:hypothetical protein
LDLSFDRAIAKAVPTTMRHAVNCIVAPNVTAAPGVVKWDRHARRWPYLAVNRQLCLPRMLADPESSDSWLRRLYELNAVVAASDERVAGNICYEHYQQDFVSSPPVSVNRSKRDRFRQACAERACMLEIGVNAGHSAYVALSSNPSLEFHGVDIGEHRYVRSAVEWLQREFPGRVHFYEGSCLEVLPALAKRGMTFDLFHIDGAKHTYYFDILNSHRMLRDGDSWVIVDDANMPPVERLWKRCLREGLVEPLAQFPPMPPTDEHRNAIGALPQLPRWRWSWLWARASFRHTRRRLQRRIKSTRR